MKNVINLLPSLIILIFPFDALAQDDFVCMKDMEARMAFMTNAAQSLQFYSEGPASRVQRQHINTALTSHAKYFPTDSGGVAVCQYYNYVGWVYQHGLRVAGKGKIEEKSFWREDYMNSKLEQDVPGEEFVLTCIEKRSDGEYPSIGCSFTRLKNK